MFAGSCLRKLALSHLALSSIFPSPTSNTNEIEPFPKRLRPNDRVLLAFVRGRGNYPRDDASSSSLRRIFIPTPVTVRKYFRLTVRVASQPFSIPNIRSYIATTNRDPIFGA